MKRKQYLRPFLCINYIKCEETIANASSFLIMDDIVSPPEIIEREKETKVFDVHF